MIKWIKRLFTKNIPTDNPAVGYWGVVNTETDESNIQGEMYSNNGRWAPGPKISDNYEPLEENYNQ